MLTSIPLSMTSTIYQVLWGDILSTLALGDIMMHLGGYHEYRGGDIMSSIGDVQYRGGKSLLFEYPHGTQDILHGTEYPP